VLLVLIVLISVIAIGQWVFTSTLRSRSNRVDLSKP